MTGKVLGVGGVKEKTLAAQRNGIEQVVFPMYNKKDVDDLPDFVKQSLTFHFVNHYKEVYEIAFGLKNMNSNSASTQPPLTM